MTAAFAMAVTARSSGAEEPRTIAISPISVVDAVCDAVTEEIMRGDVRPGMSLPEATVASRYGVSRLTARDAIARLVAHGLLQRERNRSAHLPILDRRALQELAATRGALEESSVFSRRHDPQVLDLLEGATLALRQAADSADAREVWEAELVFHRGLAHLGGNARLARLHGTSEPETRVALVQAPRVPSALHIAVQHARIVRALRDGDRDRASGELRHHARDLVDRISPPSGGSDDAVAGSATAGDVEPIPDAVLGQPPTLLAL